VNLSGKAGYEEARWGFEALQDHRYREGVRWLSDAVRYQPKMPELWYDLAIAQMNLKNTTAAIAAYRRAGELGEANAAYYLGAWYEAGDQGLPKDEQQALFWYRKAALAENNADVMNNVAWVYATSANPAIRNPAAALDYAQKATSLDKDHHDPNHLDTLAAAYYINGRYRDAVETEMIALELSPHESRPVFETNLQKYRAALRTKVRQPEAANAERHTHR
jgi:TPR repeat protein